MFFICGESTVKKASAAYLIPIVRKIIESGISFVICRNEALFYYGIFHRLPLLRAHSAVKPVISYRHGHHHFTNIKEMGRIPVAEGTYGHHFVYGPVSICFIANHPI